MNLARFLVACVLLAACHNPPTDGPAGGTAFGRGPSMSGPPPVVTGTTVEARSGKPLAGALVRGPGGIETKSDSHGRFVLRGLALGTTGELVATADGLTGKNALRALESGTLEVVLYLR